MPIVGDVVVGVGAVQGEEAPADFGVVMQETDQQVEPGGLIAWPLLVHAAWIVGTGPELANPDWCGVRGIRIVQNERPVVVPDALHRPVRHVPEPGHVPLPWAPVVWRIDELVGYVEHYRVVQHRRQNARPPE